MPRDASGNMTLPAGNPVVANTEIDAAWANPTMADLAAEVQDSLSRSGKGGMLVPFQNADGNVAAPGITFLNQTGTGFFRSAAGLGLAWIGVLKALFNATLARFYTDVQVDGKLGLATGKVDSGVANGATAVAHTLDVTAAMSTAGAKLLSIKNAGVEKFAIDKDGNIVLPVPGVVSAVSADCGVAATVVATTWADITNLTTGAMALTTKPVVLTLQGTTIAQVFGVSTAGAGYIDLKLVRTIGGVDTDISALTVNVPAGQTVYMTPNFAFIDVPPADGSYTYRIQGQANAVGLTLTVSRMKLSAVQV